MKIVSATEAKNRLGRLFADLGNGTDAIFITHHGNPRAVIVSVEEWTALSEARTRLRRLEAWEQMRAAAAEVSARNVDLTPDEAYVLADEVADEAMSQVVARARRSWEAGSG